MNEQYFTQEVDADENGWGVVGEGKREAWFALLPGMPAADKERVCLDERLRRPWRSGRKEDV